MKFAIVVAVACLGVSLAWADTWASPLKVELKRAEDSAVVTTTRHATTVAITSKSGIGGARLVRAAEGWPTRLIIRLGVRGLESLGMENGNIQFNTALDRRQPVPYWKVGKRDKRPETSEGTLAITMQQLEGAVKIIVPAELIDGNPQEISLKWIDFFRN